MRKIKILAIVFLLPFLLVWVAFIMTAFSFNPKDVFTGTAFWGMSFVYWYVASMLLPTIVSAINESKPS